MPTKKKKGGLGLIKRDPAKVHAAARRSRRAGHPPHAGMHEASLTVIVSRDVEHGYESTVCAASKGRAVRRSNRAYDLRKARGAKSCTYAYGSTPTKATVKALRSFAAQLAKRK